MLARLRSSRPAAATSTIVSATCATTSIACVRCCPAAVARRPPLLIARLNSGRLRANRRDQAKEQPGDEGDGHRCGEHPDVELWRERDGQRIGGHRPKHAYPACRQEQSEATTEQCEHDALGEELPGEPAAACAERGPRGQFLFAMTASRQDEVGDVGAGDQQQQRHRAEQEQHRRPRHHAQCVVHRLGTDTPRTLEGRIVVVQPLLDGLQFGVRCRERASRRQSPEYSGPVRRPLCARRPRREHRRDEERVVGKDPRVARQHTDHRARHVVQHEALAEDAACRRRDGYARSPR